MSYQTKHTPGPWMINSDHSKDRSQFRIHVGGKTNYGNCLASVYMGGPGALSSKKDDILANAKLIAAAPLILPALIKVVNDYEYLVDAVTKMHESGNTYVKYPEQPEWYDEAKAALAAAGVTI